MKNDQKKSHCQNCGKALNLDEGRTVRQGGHGFLSRYSMRSVSNG